MTFVRGMKGINMISYQQKVIYRASNLFRYVLNAYKMKLSTLFVVHYRRFQ